MYHDVEWRFASHLAKLGKRNASIIVEDICNLDH